jgi:hypothetical protein
MLEVVASFGTLARALLRGFVFREVLVLWIVLFGEMPFPESWRKRAPTTDRGGQRSPTSLMTPPIEETRRIFRSMLPQGNAKQLP